MNWFFGTQRGILYLYNTVGLCLLEDQPQILLA